MTSRERIQAALEHRQPDRTPIFEYVLLQPVASDILGRPYIDFAGGSGEWLALAMENGWEQAVRQYAVDRLDLAERLGHDMLYVVPNPVSPGGGPSVPPPETDDPVERVHWNNERSAETPLTQDEDRFLVYHFLREAMEQRGVDLPVLAPAYAHGVWTNVDLMQVMVLEPEVAHRHFQLTTRRTLALIDTYVNLYIDQIGVGGDFAGNRPLISPAAYREFIMPEVRACSRHAHAAGKWTVNASDGDLWSVIDDFLLGCEVDGYLEIDQHAGMDLRRLKEDYGDRITFYGNIDCGNTMSFGTEEEIRRATIDCLDAGSGNGGHILCVSNAITASVPLRKYMALVNAYRDYFGLPVL
ncbi:MAG: uroporphyrinogen decarboxylase family protein [Armatimonadota bacterium]